MTDDRQHAFSWSDEANLSSDGAEQEIDEGVEEATPEAAETTGGRRVVPHPFQAAPGAPTGAPTPGPAADLSDEALFLLDQFAERDGCEEYTKDTDRLRLLIDYLWLRQLTPELYFETFLEKYAEVADFDKDNLKHPKDAIYEILPRSAKAAEARDSRKWTVKEVVDFVCVYVDAIRAAEAVGDAPPCSLNDFIRAEETQQRFLAGEFQSENRTKAKKRKKPEKIIRPARTGDRSLLTLSDSHQIRGEITNIYTVHRDADNETEIFADFRADSGEEYPDLSITQLELIADPPPHRPIDDETEQEKPELFRETLRIPKNEYEAVKRDLSAAGPVGTVHLEGVIWHWDFQYPDGITAVVRIANGERGPYVDAFLSGEGGEIIHEIPPRENLDGIYSFEAPAGVYVLEVRGNQ